MANGHGGARPGAGRKKSEAVAIQEKRRDVFQSHVTHDDWVEIVLKAVQQAKGGDLAARSWLSAWVVGAPPKPVEAPDLVLKLVE